MEEKVILIQGALDIEISYFLSKIESKKEEIIAGYEFYTGFINTIKVIISKIY